VGSPGVILLDTHGLLWLDRDDQALGPSSRELIRSAWGNGSLAVSAISFWEVAMLAAWGRIELRQSAESWRSDCLGAGLEEIALAGSLAVAAAELADFHADPADRFIAATAMAHGLLDHSRSVPTALAGAAALPRRRDVTAFACR